MALKLGKCRLCLKLGDFYSIFTVDNALQLAEMVMECSRIKIYEGDGLPDKVCAECIEKLSSAYIFKQQCERSDQELRRNYVPPPGFSITPTNRQSSDSGFSNRTDFSIVTKSEETLPQSSPRPGKRSLDTSDNISAKTKNADYTAKASSSRSRVEELRVSQKRPRMDSESTKDSDYEDNGMSHFSAETDSDDPLVHKCEHCDKQFLTRKGLLIHSRTHSQSRTKDTPVLTEDVVVDIPPYPASDTTDEESKITCEKCGQVFKLKIMLKRHVCQEDLLQKQLKVSLEDVLPDNKFDCEYCSTKFKTIDNLEKHLRVVHSAVLKQAKAAPMAASSKKLQVPCLYCHKLFDDYFMHTGHFNTCSMRSAVQTYICLVCKRKFGKKELYLSHIKDAHFETKQVQLPVKKTSIDKTPEKELLQCRLCTKKLQTQDLLIAHLASHMTNNDDADDSRDSTLNKDDSLSQNSDNSYANTSSRLLNCRFCDKTFSYKKALTTHIAKHISGEIPKKEETKEYLESEESSQDDGDNTCDICDKEFAYKKLLIQHKKTKHNKSSGHKRAKIALKDCDVKCILCDISMKVSEVNAHNLIHTGAGIKPRNVYTCTECNATFKSCQALGSHIQCVHRLKQQPSQNFQVADLADFCEVVVTKTEPLDAIQSRNDLGKVPENSVEGSKPLVDLSGFTCPICSKKMGTLISLKRHINWHSNVGNNLESKHECFVCKASFKFIRHYKLHMREHYHDTNLDPKFLTCTICNRKSKHLRAAQMHMKYHSQTRFNTKDYQCSICKRVFQFRKVYLSHMAIHYKRGESIQNTVVGDYAANTQPVMNGEPNQCPHCGKICDSESSLKCHVSWHKSKTSLFGSRYECEFCDLLFTNKKRHELHVRSHYEDDNGPFKCQICGKGFIVEDYFRRHVKGHNFDHQSHKKRIAKLRMNKVKCPICPRYYPDLVKLIRHLRRTHPESKMIKADPDAPPPQIYPCKLCAKVFQNEQRLQKHEESHLRKHQFFKCKFCGKKAVSLKNHNIHIKSHLTKNYIDEPLKCSECDKTFIKGYALHHHLRDDHGINETWISESGQAANDGSLQELQCSVCYKVLASKGNFERHIDYHNLLRCNYCFDYFGSLKFLEGHLAYSCHKKKLVGDTEVHSKKVKCHICYKAFHVQIKLDCHMRTQHNISVDKECGKKEKYIVCDYCFRVFENEDALSAHKIYHRTVGYYGCIYCNRKFNTLVLYRKHKNHHFAQINVDDPFKCEHCEEKFTAFREMIYHMRDEHIDDKEWIIMPKESKEEKCHICNKIFFNVQRHIQLHEENRCKKCGEYFFSRPDFDNHLCSIESDDEPEDNENDCRPKYEECTFCFKPITKTNSKLKHDLIHKGSGSISCRFCALKFKTIDAFNIHAFSHRSRKYKKNPLKCRKCNERFVQYGPLIKHMKSVHKISEKMHYRTTVLPERCVICGDMFPNLHNHYRAHLQHQCQNCNKYFSSNKLFLAHKCDVEDADPSKVFVSDENLMMHINSYIPQDESDDQKFYGIIEEDVGIDPEPPKQDLHRDDSQDEGSQISEDFDVKFPISIESPIISEVLSLYEEKKEKDMLKLAIGKNADSSVTAENNSDDDIVEIIDNNSTDGHYAMATITIDDD